MKTREQKQKDLDALTEKLQKAQAAMLVGFNKLTVSKDLELRNQLREAGVEYQVVKNTLTRIAAEGTPFAQVNDYLKGTTAIATTNGDPVSLSKAISKFTKANPEVFSFKVGIVEGKVVNLQEVDAIANLPSKEELISKIMFLINCQAQRLVTVISAVPRNLVIVVKQIGDQKSA
jgi:large subunit ribosomal protein L10